MSEEKKMYFKVYQDKDYMSCGFLVGDLAEVLDQLKMWYEDESHCGDELPPVIEPIWLTEQEFKDLPEFEGY